VGLDQFSLGGWTKVNSRGLGVRTKVYEGDWTKLHKAGGVWTKVHNGGWYNVNISGPKGECRTKVTYKVQGHRKNIFRGGDQDS
jgi:hypothetical protein